MTTENNSKSNGVVSKSTQRPQSVGLWGTIVNIKLGWLVTVLFLLSVISYGLSFFIVPSGFWSDLLKILGDALLPTAIVAFAYEWLIRREAAQSLSAQLRDALESQQKLVSDQLREIVPESLMLNPEVLSVVHSSTEKQDEILQSVLSARFQDQQMGSALYQGVVRQALRYQEQHRDVHFDAILSELPPSEPESLRREFYDIVINYRCQTKLRAGKVIFTRVTGQDQFNARADSLEHTFMFRVRERPELPIGSEKALKVLSFMVNGIELQRESQLADDGAYEIVCEDPKLAELLNKEVSVSISVQTKLTRLGHIFFNAVIRPTRNFTGTFTWGGTDIDLVRVYDFFVSENRPIIYLAPPDNPTTATVELNGWSFPKGGAAFVWRFRGEKEWHQTRPL
jgi:hypothetical protein